MSADQLVVEGRVQDALAELMQQVRRDASSPKLRVFLFQILCVTGQWKRALDQLEVAGQLDAEALPMVQTYREAIRCELLRAKVFSGKEAPLVLGEPEPWLGVLIEALQYDGRNQPEQASLLRQNAFDQAPASAGVLNDRPFAWIADSDSRLGPVLEAIVNGRYYWIPFARFRRIIVEAPTDLRDVVWMPASFEFTNGGEVVALIPCRYPGTEHSDDGRLLLSRKTTWTEVSRECYRGLGQRTLTTDADEVGIMDVRKVVFDIPENATA